MFGFDALFLMTSGAVMDRVADALKNEKFEIIATNLSNDREQKLREVGRSAIRRLADRPYRDRTTTCVDLHFRPSWRKTDIQRQRLTALNVDVSRVPAVARLPNFDLMRTFGQIDRKPALSLRALPGLAVDEDRRVGRVDAE
jgi:hypothetical protein